MKLLCCLIVVILLSDVQVFSQLDNQNNTASIPIRGNNIVVSRVIYNLDVPGEKNIKALTDLLTKDFGANVVDYQCLPGDFGFISGDVRLLVPSLEYSKACKQIEEFIPNYFIEKQTNEDITVKFELFLDRRKNLETLLQVFDKELNSTSDSAKKMIIIHEISNRSQSLQKVNKDIKELEIKSSFSEINIKWAVHSKSVLSVKNKSNPQKKDNSASKAIVLSKVGDEARYNTDDNVLLKIEIDAETSDLRANLDHSSGDIYLKVVDKTLFQPVFISNPCESIIIPEGPIPQLIIADDLKREQVIITPIIKSECSASGYEIRYGTIQSGCSKGKDVLRKFRKCFPINKKFNK